MSPGAFVVTADTLNVRLAANTTGKIVGKVYGGQKVEVLEVTNGWARISEYFDGGAEGLTGNVARWVFAIHLSSNRQGLSNQAASADSSDLLGAQSAATEGMSPGLFIVTTGTLNVRLAANASGSVAGKLRRGQEVEVLEFDKDWARISEYYDGQTEGLSGRVARWVFAAHLATSPSVPKDIDVNSPVAQAIEASDDLDRHQHTFVRVSQKLVDSGECDISEFIDIGGWWRSAAHKPRPIYYTYCGGATNSHRIYVDTSTGQTFR